MASLHQHEVDLDAERNLQKLKNNYKLNTKLVTIAKNQPHTVEMQNDISYEIENIYRVCDCNTYIEAITLFMDLYSYEYNLINKILSATILSKLQTECLKNGALKASIDELKCYDITKWKG